MTIDHTLQVRINGEHRRVNEGISIAEAKDPIMMARAMKSAVEAGRLAYLSGRMQKRRYADPSSPLAGLI